MKDSIIEIKKLRNVLQAVLRNGLNPYLAWYIMQRAIPNLVFDLIALFRCQAVDRVVISMINKGRNAVWTRHVLKCLNR